MEVGKYHKSIRIHFFCLLVWFRFLFLRGSLSAHHYPRVGEVMTGPRGSLTTPMRQVERLSAFANIGYLTLGEQPNEAC